jgi:hypothetical protein
MTSLVDRLFPNELWQRIRPLLPPPPAAPEAGSPAGSLTATALRRWCSWCAPRPRGRCCRRLAALACGSGRSSMTFATAVVRTGEAERTGTAVGSTGRRPGTLGRSIPTVAGARQRDLGMRGASWVLGCLVQWRSCLLRWWVAGPRPPGANMASGARGTAGSRKRPKNVHRIRDGSADAERTFFGPSTPDGPCASRNPPAESAGPRRGAGPQARRTEREADPDS